MKRVAKLFLALAVVASPMLFTSCDDYDDDGYYYHNDLVRDCILRSRSGLKDENKPIGSSCPTTLLCKISPRCNNFSFSPSTNFFMFFSTFIVSSNNPCYKIII